jgi:hypothetical protein
MDHIKARMVARILFAKDLVEVSGSFSYEEMREHFPDVDFRASYESAWRDLREAAESELAFHLSRTGD